MSSSTSGGKGKSGKLPILVYWEVVSALRRISPLVSERVPPGSMLVQYVRKPVNFSYMYIMYVYDRLYDTQYT